MSDFAEDTNVLTNDCISRQSAIDAIYDAFCYAYCDNCEKEMNEDLCGDCHRKYQNWSASKKIIKKVINNLPSVQPEIRYYGQFEIKDPILISERQWIPVSERLPEEKDAGILKKLGTSKRSEYVLATVEVKGERMTVTACTYDGEWDWNMKYAFPDYKIIAWMPMPEPYMGEKE